MAAEVVLGAAVGAALGELLKIVNLQITQISNFGSLLSRLKETLTSIQPLFDDTTKLSQVLDRPEEETARFTNSLQEGRKLVSKCSNIRWWNLYNKLMYAKKLISLNNKMLRFFQMEVPAITLVNVLKILVGINDLNRMVDRQHVANGYNFNLSIPGGPEFITGFDQHLANVKIMLLQSETQILVISASGGSGKTTLAQMLCHDRDIKDQFGDNILYVTVARSNLQTIAKKLFEHHGNSKWDFQTHEEAKNQIENLLRKTGSNNRMLLVLDDVSHESQSIVEDLKFQIPGYKILVTSRSSFSRFNSTYNLSLLNEKEAKTLFRYHAFLNGNQFNVPDNLVKKVVKACKSLPLALKVVGASLREQPVVIWENTVQNMSEGQSILRTDNDALLSRLRTCIDALHALPIVQECFFDFGSFPEDERIEGTILEDMWVELYNPEDDKGFKASVNLRELASRNLVNLIPKRKNAGEVKGYCEDYYVTQHDLLRELAIHLSGQDPEAQRERLFMEFKGNRFPTWWVEQPYQSINARILSISTDETFSSVWHDLDAPNVQVLKLNIRSKEYTLPHFISRMSQLKVLIVTGYGDYPVQLHNLEVIGSLPNLRRIRFEHISLSHSIQSIFKLQCLWKLTFVTCKIGDALNGGTTTNNSPDMLPSLTVLEFDHCHDLKKLPAGICSLHRLQKLIITNCQELDPLPGGLGSLSNLQILRLHGCTKLEKLPESIGRMHDLSSIDMSDCLSIRVLPEQIGELSGLRVVNMSGCHVLGELPVSLRKLLQLETVICDEETSYLWKIFGSDLHLPNVKINLLDDDRLASFMKIHQ